MVQKIYYEDGKRVMNCTYGVKFHITNNKDKGSIICPECKAEYITMIHSN